MRQNMEKTTTHGNCYGMVIDLDKCTGCGTCMVACASENNVTVRADESDKERSITWMQLYKIDNGKPFPDTEVNYFPRPCMHCDEDGRGGHYSPCVSVCVSTATKLILQYHFSKYHYQSNWFAILYTALTTSFLNVLFFLLSLPQLRQQTMAPSSLRNHYPNLCHIPWHPISYSTFKSYCG